ncbi:hypothetical protein LUZ60_014351 [Juncus effusus]|nr:hypothetical protein LUZ60_014351 [Juncus effusus]
MAASSPASSSKGGDDSSFFNGNNNNNNNNNSAFDMPKPNLRGLNKPKCVKCGNVARSRCPFQCCKSCCSIAQNPCHIHVLDVKKNSTLPDKASNSGASASLEQALRDSNSSSNASWRLNSLRQLSARHLEFLRARKPLAKKDTAQINKWRIMKLREHIEADIEAENESFDRYMQNISFLEEIFSVPESPASISMPDIKLGLKSNSENSAKSKEKLRELVDKKLQDLNEINYEKKEGPERNKGEINDLIEKLSKAKSEDDLKPCFEICAKIFDKFEGSNCDFLRNKACTSVPVDEELLDKIGTEFSSVDQVAQL